MNFLQLGSILETLVFLAICSAMDVPSPSAFLVVFLSSRTFLFHKVMGFLGMKVNTTA